MEDVHFMERIERLGWRETELALRLYREPEIVKLLLQDAAAPEAPRIAIALSQAPEPAHVVVARDGAFVTCLGSGMSLGGLPVVSHQRIQRAADRHEQLRGTIAYIDWAKDNRGSIKRMWRSVLNDGHRVPREVMAGLAPLVGLFQSTLIDEWIREDQIARELVYANTNRFARGRERLTSTDVDVLQRIWRCHWATGHMTALYGLAEREALDRVNEMMLSRPMGDGPLLLGVHAMRFGFWPTTIRGAWLGARIGQGSLLHAKAGLSDEQPKFALASAFIIAFVGASRAKFRAEAQKALAVPPPSKGTRFDDLLVALVRRGLADVLESAVLDAGVKVQEEHIASLRTSHPAPPGLEAHVETIATALLANRAFTFAADFKKLFHELPALAWYARADALDWYLPSDLLSVVATWQPSDSIELIKGTIGLGTHVEGPPRKQEPKVGRNEACPCGSGKKHKRCCGA